MNHKIIAYHPRVSGTISRLVFGLEIVTTADGSVSIEGLKIGHGQSKEAFVRWFGSSDTILMKQFNALMLSRGIETGTRELQYHTFVTRVKEWDLAYTWYHLIENSLQSLGLQSDWRVATKVLLTDTHVVLEVEDNGSGISRSRLQEIFCTNNALHRGNKLRKAREKAGFRFGGHARFLRWFLDDLAREQRDVRRKHPLYIEVITNCGGEKSTGTIRTDGVTIDAEGKDSAGTRVRVFYPGESFMIDQQH